MLVVNKPSGMTVNRAETTRNTLQDWIDGTGKIPPPATDVSQTAVIETGDSFDTPETFYERSGTVHRLDKETSGVILIAKTVEAFFALQKQFRERTVTKQYLALVHGEVKPETGEVNAPIGRQEWNRMRFGVVAGGKEAQTFYKVREYRKLTRGKEILSLVELMPKTGRTHQIRVHMKYIGYPLFADFLYAGRKTQRDDRKYLGRVFLHAEQISFIHPRTGEQLTFNGELPEALQQFLSNETQRVTPGN